MERGRFREGGEWTHATAGGDRRSCCHIEIEICLRSEAGEGGCMYVATRVSRRCARPRLVGCEEAQLAILGDEDQRRWWTKRRRGLHPCWRWGLSCPGLTEAAGWGLHLHADGREVNELRKRAGARPASGKKRSGSTNEGTFDISDIRNWSEIQSRAGDDTDRVSAFLRAERRMKGKRDSAHPGGDFGGAVSRFHTAVRIHEGDVQDSGTDVPAVQESQDHRLHRAHER